MHRFAEQEALPIFDDETVVYTIVHEDSSSYAKEHGLPWEFVRIRVDQIDALADPDLRDALWDQRNYKVNDDIWAISCLVDADGRFNRAVEFPRYKLLDVQPDNFVTD